MEHIENRKQFQEEIHMKILTILNIVIGLIFAIAIFFCRLSLNPILVLMSGLIILLFLSLILINFVFIFIMWCNYKYFSFIPFAISLFFFVVLGYSASIGHKRGIYNKPEDPSSYFNEERKKELTAIAEELLVAQDEKSGQAAEKKLNKHHLTLRNINHYSNVVEFGYYRSRIISTYIFAKDGLPEIYSTKPVITEEDILHWGELVSIVKTENDLSKYNRSEVSFETEIVYPFLVANLDKKFVDKLASLPSIENLDSFLAKNKDLPIMKVFDKMDSDYENIITNQLSNEEKLNVVEVLNRHYQLSSGLIENENISWHSLGSLVFCEHTYISSSFPVNKHLRQLIYNDVISKKDKEGHLKIKPNLSDKEIREIEWLQLGIMNHIYGNLINKTEYWSNNKTKLADNWYFYRH